jgi:hypothetical protein
LEIEEKIEDILSKIVPNPNFIPLAPVFALSLSPQQESLYLFQVLTILLWHLKLSMLLDVSWN